MTPQRLIEIIKTSVESQGAIFFLGNDVDAALKLINTNTSGGFVLMESDIEENMDRENETQSYTARLSFLRHDRPDSESMDANEQSSDDASDTIMFSMYNLKADVINHINDTYADEIFADDKRSLWDRKIKISKGVGVVTGGVVFLNCKVNPDEC